MTKLHEIKSHPQFFAAVLDGSKPFEIRKNDRQYMVGDRVHLHEWNPDTGLYTGRLVVRTITYITGFSQSPGWVVMGLSRD